MEAIEKNKIVKIRTKHLIFHFCCYAQNLFLALHPYVSVVERVYNRNLWQKLRIMCRLQFDLRLNRRFPLKMCICVSRCRRERCSMQWPRLCNAWTVTYTENEENMEIGTAQQATTYTIVNWPLPWPWCVFSFFWLQTSVTLKHDCMRFNKSRQKTRRIYAKAHIWHCKTK